MRILNTALLNNQRIKLGLEETDYAKHIGISLPYYSLLMSRKRKPSIAFLEKAYFALGFTPNDLLILDQKNPKYLKSRIRKNAKKKNDRPRILVR